MRKESIKQQIDNRIIKELTEKVSPEKIRQDLLTTCNKFNQNISEKPKSMVEGDIETIKDVRSRYLSFYVFFAQQRIIDLYKVETRDMYGWD